MSTYQDFVSSSSNPPTCVPNVENQRASRITFVVFRLYVVLIEVIIGTVLLEKITAKTHATPNLGNAVQEEEGGPEEVD